MAGAAGLAKRSDNKSADAFRTISEVAAILDVPQHVLRFWESKFSQVRPLKRGGGRRYYRPEDIELLVAIRGLLYDDGYTIKGVQKLLRDGTLKAKRQAAPDPQPTSPVVANKPATAVKPRDSLSAAQRRALQGVLDELERLKALVERTRN